MELHKASLVESGIEDAETLKFWRDLKCVMVAIHQGMSIAGPWMEARTKLMVRSWLPSGWYVSGPSQIFDQVRDDLRSRSWDLVIHRRPEIDLPPEASPESGLPLLPRCAVAAVIDTKTFFADPSTYAKQPIFNILNNAVDLQTEFLGSGIEKIILAASSSRSPDAMLHAGNSCGLSVFSLASYKAGPVSQAEDRETVYQLQKFKDGSYPLQGFKSAVFSSIMAAVE